MALPPSVILTEVGPRDGLQNEAQFIDTQVKLAFIEQLIAAGCKRIEATSFVSPKRIPQLADAKALFARLPKHEHVTYSALIPNMQGMELALEAGVHEIAVFTAASDTFCQRNIECSIAESLQRFEPVLSAAKQHNIPARGYISCTFDCPYEGPIALDKALQLADRLLELGCTEIAFADTVGKANPHHITALCQSFSASQPLDIMALHLHDTYGQALVNLYAALQCGVTRFDTATAGLGGCPYAAGASGNLATEDALYLFEGLNIHTGLDLDAIYKAGHYICEQIGKPSPSKVTQAMAQCEQQ